MKKTFYKLIFFLISIGTLSACQNQDYTLKLQFKIDEMLVKREISEMLEADKIDLGGYKIPYPDSTKATLLVEFTNPRTLPNNKDSLFNLEKNIALKIKSLMMNPNQVHEINIAFTRRDTVKGILITKTTKDSFHNQEFNISDL